MDRSLAKSSNWVSIYLVAVALGLTTLGLVMLFSAGAVRGAQALLTKQFIWLGMSIIVGVYAAFMDLDWLKRRAWLLYGICILSLALTLILMNSSVWSSMRVMKACSWSTSVRSLASIREPGCPM